MTESEYKSEFESTATVYRAMEIIGRQRYVCVRQRFMSRRNL